jgi:hypothetical protein
MLPSLSKAGKRLGGLSQRDADPASCWLRPDRASDFHGHVGATQPRDG